MSAVRFQKSDIDWERLKAIVEQFYKLNEFPKGGDGNEFISIVGEIDPNKLDKEMDLVHKTTLKDKFHNEITRPSYRIMMDLGNKGKFSVEDLQGRFDTFIDILRNVENYHLQLYESIYNPTENAPFVDKNSRMKYNKNNKKNIYKTYQNLYNNFVDNYNNFMNQYYPSKNFRCKTLRDYDDVRVGV